MCDLLCGLAKSPRPFSSSADAAEHSHSYPSTTNNKQRRLFFLLQRERIKQLRGGKNVKKSRDWIKDKKERARRKGKEVRPDSKFTGRKRKDRF